MLVKFCSETIWPGSLLIFNNKFNFLIFIGLFKLYICNWIWFFEKLVYFIYDMKLKSEVLLLKQQWFGSGPVIHHTERQSVRQ